MPLPDGEYLKQIAESLKAIEKHLAVLALCNNMTIRKEAAKYGVMFDDDEES